MTSSAQKPPATICVQHEEQGPNKQENELENEPTCTGTGTGTGMTLSDNTHAPEYRDISFSDHDSVEDRRRLLGNDDDEDDLEATRKIAEKETYRVRIWRFVTTDTIIMVSCVLILTAYALLRDSEKQDFEKAYRHSSETLAAAVGHNYNSDVSALTGTFQTTIGNSNSNSNSEETPQAWPFLYPSDFPKTAELLRQLSTIDTLYFAPLVTQDQELEYLSFVDAVVAEQTNETFQQYHPSVTHFDPPQKTFVRAPQDDLYFPLLASSPKDYTNRILNWNLLDLVPPSLASAQDLLDQLESLNADEALLFPPTLTNNLNNEDYNYLIAPVRRTTPDSPTEPQIIGLVVAAQSWKAKLTQVVSAQHANGIVVVINYRTNSYTYQMDGTNVTLLGQGDLHDPVYDDYRLKLDLGLDVSGHLHLSIYPTRSLELSYRTVFPEVFAFVLFLGFFAVTVAFFKYDVLVDRRNEKLIDKFARSNNLVSQLYPKMYRDRLMGDDSDHNNDDLSKTHKNSKKSTANRINNFMSQGDTKNNMGQTHQQVGRASKPLADIFPSVSILFADISGFTAWSSQREPFQVFRLLETLYSAFDKCAERHRVFKVETIGDCYVAAVGLPQPRKHHAKVMVRFSLDIMERMIAMTRELEIELGPDTGDLKLRTGINSGAVTAGILRGQKARFQLFGDAMNTASRIESTGLPGKIQISQSTADLLIEANVGHWIVKRDEKVSAKGKGLLQTYWVIKSLKTATGSSQERDELSSTSGLEAFANLSDDERSVTSQQQVNTNQRTVLGVKDEQGAQPSSSEARKQRLVAWNVETLLRHIKLIVAHRKRQRIFPDEEVSSNDVSLSDNGRRKIPLEEVKEVITLPVLESSPKDAVDDESIEIPDRVVEQLKSFVSAIGQHYNDCEFHSFDHASHVTSSVSKLLSRIVAHREDGASGGEEGTRYDSFGITSDPIVQFALLLSSLVHDLDHVGVPNTQLVKENPELAEKYGHRSIAEQHSLDLAWDLFISEEYEALRCTVCATSSELQLLREIVVNAVLATDIIDKDLKALRNARWEKAFAGGSSSSSHGSLDKERREDTIVAANRKATVVIEHLMQASDISHTMQHWHVFIKWNERLLREVYRAYREGRADKDPLESWYEGEIGFFDYYVIPLAKKLKECGVFGVASDEYLDYALLNREEWEAKGQKIVENIAKSLQSEYSS